MQKEKINRRECEYTVRRYTYGVAIFGSVRCPEFFALAEAWRDEFTIIDSKLAQTLGASFLYTTEENSVKWRKELGIE